MRKVEPDYCTDAMTYTQVSVIEESATGPRVRSLGESGVRSVAERLGRGRGRREGGRLQEDQVLHARERRLRRRAPARDADAHDRVLAHGARGARARASTHGRAAAIDGLRGIGVALETVATLALMCDPRDLGTTLGDAAIGDEDGAVRCDPAEGARGAAAGVQPDALSLRARPGRDRSRRADLRAARGAPRARAAADRELPLRRGCPACVGPGDFAATVSRKSVALELLQGIARTA